MKISKTLSLYRTFQSLCQEMSALENELESIRGEASELCSLKDTSRQPGDAPDTMEVKKVTDEVRSFSALICVSDGNALGRLVPVH